MITSELHKPGMKMLSARGLPSVLSGKMDREADSEQREKKRILLIQEVMAILDVNKYILESKGYEVACARDGTEGIDLFVEARNQGLAFDVVMIDLYMHRCPGGPVTISRLREIDTEVRIIVFTDFFDARARTCFPENSSCGILQKPYRIQELCDVVTRVISGQESHPL